MPAKKIPVNTANPINNDVREEIFVPRGQANEEQFIIISVNGINYQIPRGKSSRVPRAVAKEYRRSIRAQEALDELRDRMMQQ